MDASLDVAHRLPLILPFQGIVPRIGQRVFVGAHTTVLGDVTLSDDTSIWFQCTVRGDVNWIRIGPRSNIQDHCCLHVTNGTWPLVIEEEVSVAHGVTLHGCAVRWGALIGMSSTIMDGAEIGEGCLVAAGSLVRERFVAPPHTLVAGWPAEVKRDLTKEQRDLVARIWTNYVRYKQAYVDDGWRWARAPAVDHPRPGFAEGHPAP